MSQSYLNAPEVSNAFVERLAVTKHRMNLGQIAVETPSSNASEIYSWLQAVPMAQLFTGSTNFEDLPANKITLVNEHYRAAFELGGPDYRRDKTGSAVMRAQELADSAELKKWELAQTLLKNGDGATNGLAYDGQFFFDTDHSVGKSGTFNNAVTASEISTLNVSTPAAPTPEEMTPAILDMIGHLMTAKDAAGRPVNENATRFAVCYRPTGGMMGAVQAAIRANNLSGGETNVLRVGEFEIFGVPMPLLDWTTEIAVLRVDGFTKPLICQTEEEAKLKILGEDSEHFDKTDRVALIATWRGALGYGQYLHAVKGTFS